MRGNLFGAYAVLWRACALALVVATASGCGGPILAGPGETISIPPLATEDVASACTFDMNLPDEPLAVSGQQPTANEPKYNEAAVLVVYERGDSSTLFTDAQIQNMAATLHLATVFAHQCNAGSYNDIQVDAAKGPGRALFAALSQYAVDSNHPEVATDKVILYGFSAAGVLSITLSKAYPDRVLTAIPYATGSAYLDLDTVAVTPAMAGVPTLVLANAYDSQSGDQKSYRYFKKGAAQGAPWGFGVQNHTDHCCTLSTRDVTIPWITALVPKPAEPTFQWSMLETFQVNPYALPVQPRVSFLTYTDGWPAASGDIDLWIPTAGILPVVAGPERAWVPDAATADAWYKWVLSPGTN